MPADLDLGIELVSVRLSGTHIPESLCEVLGDIHYPQSSATQRAEIDFKGRLEKKIVAKSKGWIL